MNGNISGKVLRHAFACPPEDKDIEEAIKFARELQKQKDYDVIVVKDDVYATATNFCVSAVFVYAFKLTEIDIEKSIEYCSKYYTIICGKGEAELYRDRKLIKKISGKFLIGTDGPVSVTAEKERIGVHRDFSKYSYVSEKIPTLFREVSKYYTLKKMMFTHRH